MTETKTPLIDVDFDSTVEALMSLSPPPSGKKAKAVAKRKPATKGRKKPKKAP